MSVFVRVRQFDKDMLMSDYVQLRIFKAAWKGRGGGQELPACSGNNYCSHSKDKRRKNC